MNKAEFVDAVAEGAELSKAEASRAIDAMVASITRALKKGEVPDCQPVRFFDSARDLT